MRQKPVMNRLFGSSGSQVSVPDRTVDLTNYTYLTRDYYGGFINVWAKFGPVKRWRIRSKPPSHFATILSVNNLISQFGIIIVGYIYDPGK